MPSKIKTVLNSSALRQAFISFLEERGYDTLFEGSASIIPPKEKLDLLFVNAGIIQVRPLISSISRKGFSIQRCIRISGKHCDLEEIGSSTRHHTCFEMMGHFIWGEDSDLKAGLEDALDFLLSLGLSSSKLSFTYHPAHT